MNTIINVIHNGSFVPVCVITLAEVRKKINKTIEPSLIKTNSDKKYIPPHLRKNVL